MSATSKSSRRVPKTAYALAQRALPAYSHRFILKKFTFNTLGGTIGPDRSTSPVHLAIRC